jgi:CarD family transcriptional regulator
MGKRTIRRPDQYVPAHRQNSNLSKTLGPKRCVVKRGEVQMRLNIGTKIVYPAQGPCIIGSIVSRVIGNQQLSFYQLTVLNNGGMELFVPVNKVKQVGIRPLLERDEVPKLLERLQQPAKEVAGWRQRNLYNLKLFAAGSAFDLAEVIESLTELSETKSLAVGEQKTLERARELLICELSVVLREAKAIAENLVDEALNARKEGLKLELRAKKKAANELHRKTWQGNMYDQQRRNPAIK